MTKSLVLAVVLATSAFSARGESPADADDVTVLQRMHDARMPWWREAKFGMFIHFGLYAIPAGVWKGHDTHHDSAWLMNDARIPLGEYAALEKQFNPTKLDAARWARIAKSAGMKYVVLTTKHHDGFCLFDSKRTDYDVMSTPYHRDIVKEVSDAVRAEGLRMGFYYSLIDWHHDQFDYAKTKQLPYPLHGKPSPNGPRDQGKYIVYLHAQVNELLSNYGPVCELWFDYSSLDFQGDAAWRAFDLLRMIRAKQPETIVNNRLFRLPEAGWAGMAQADFAPRLGVQYGDFITPEQAIPKRGMPGVDWESCMTINKSWGYRQNDSNWKSAGTLIRNLVDIVSKGGNYLLNVGPTAEGEIPPESIERLEAMGRWLAVNGEAIYGTTASPFKHLDWGRCTQKPGKLYLHVFDWPKGELVVPGLKNQVTKAYLLSDIARKPLDVAQSDKGVSIRVPSEAPDKNVSVIVLEIVGQAADVAQ